MKTYRQILCVGVLLLTLCLTGCKPRRPGVVMSDAKMEEVLVDYHIAKALGEDASRSENFKRTLLLESIYTKHGITQADFDTAMAWYSRNPEQLYKVYEKVNQRLKKQKDAIVALIALRDNKPLESAAGDSIDVWTERQIYRLTGMPLNNKLTFLIPSDPNFEERDTMRWSLRFRYPKRRPDSLSVPVMAMQIVYDKDTLISKAQRIDSTGVYSLSLYADTLGRIKEVYGFVYYPPQPSVARALLLDSIRLMRYHAKDSLVLPASDTLQVETPAAVEASKTDNLPDKPLPTRKPAVTPKRGNRALQGIRENDEALKNAEL